MRKAVVCGRCGSENVVVDGFEDRYIKYRCLKCGLSWVELYWGYVYYQG